MISHPNTYGLNYDELAALHPYTGSLTVTRPLADGHDERQHALERLRHAGQQMADD